MTDFPFASSCTVPGPDSTNCENLKWTLKTYTGHGPGKHSESADTITLSSVEMSYRSYQKRTVGWKQSDTKSTRPVVLSRALSACSRQAAKGRSCLIMGWVRVCQSGEDSPSHTFVRHMTFYMYSIHSKQGER